MTEPKTIRIRCRMPFARFSQWEGDKHVTCESCGRRIQEGETGGCAAPYVKRQEASNEAA